MKETESKIIYTYTDEAPALATLSLLPIIQTFASACDVKVETRDISLAGRILANFPDSLRPEQRVSDALAEVGRFRTAEKRLRASGLSGRAGERQGKGHQSSLRQD